MWIFLGNISSCYDEDGGDDYQKSSYLMNPASHFSYHLGLDQPYDLQEGKNVIRIIPCHFDAFCMICAHGLL